MAEMSEKNVTKDPNNWHKGISCEGVLSDSAILAIIFPAKKSTILHTEHPRTTAKEIS